MSKTDSSTYCKLSHISLAVQNEGDVCVCNKNTQSFEDGKRNKLYLHDVGLKKMWSSPTKKLVSTGLDYNKKLESCNACWHDEAAGVLSSRQKYNILLKDVTPLPTQPRILIIKPSNICNLGCRTCQPSTSTSLYQDFYKLETEMKYFSGTFKNYTQQFETIRNGLGKNNTEVWDTFEEWIPGLEFIDMYGGEPMLAPAMWARLISAANQNKLSNTAIQYHTNGTLWNQEYIDILPKFKNVNIVISVDAVDPAQLSYIRYGIDRDSLLKNIKQYYELAKQYSNINVTVSCSVSIYNVWYIDSIFEGLKAYNLPISINNTVYAPEQYDMRHLPTAVKQQLIKKLNAPAFAHIVNILEHNIPGCDIWWPKFWQEVKILDSIRDEKFANVFPEYYQALAPYLPE
jgi:sulfatase maturation enzyme AslB (radical SAM superfamily)